MPHFCVGCHSNCTIEQPLARVWENLALAQCKFVTNLSHKQAGISFTHQVVSHLVQAAAYLSQAQNPRLTQAMAPWLILSTAYVRHEQVKCIIYMVSLCLM